MRNGKISVTVEHVRCGSQMEIMSDGVAVARLVPAQQSTRRLGFTAIEQVAQR
jgi:antitoxin (DNA-binding transcriptional repressor) of toxin-antitoxin stability system